MNGNSSVTKILLFVLPVLFAAIMLALIYFKAAQIKSVTGELVTEQAALQQQTQNVKALKKLKDEEVLFRQQYSETLKMMPQEPMEEELIRDLQQKAGLVMSDFTQIRFSPRVQKSGYTDMPVDISFSGDYRKLIQFIKLIRNNERAIRLDSITVNAAQEGTSEIKAEITAHSFCLGGTAAQQMQQ